MHLAALQRAGGCRGLLYGDATTQPAPFMWACLMERCSMPAPQYLGPKQASDQIRRAHLVERT